MGLYGGDFEKREKIQKGGMAWVFKGWQVSLKRPVAIKILFPQLAEDPKLRERFLQEGYNAANMDHENIVHVYRAGDEGGEPYIAMEFINGLDLHRWVERYGKLPIEIALVAFRDICRGLEHAHERGVIHRDIKPSNVMLSQEGVVKLMDFGLARRMDFDGSLTTSGMFLGTVPYMSPEQAARQDMATPSDIFSLGIVGYELLGGERPFKGDTPSEITRQIQVVDPPTLGTLNPLVPEEMVRTIHKMLVKSPEGRLRSVTEVLRYVEEAMETLGIRHDRYLLRDYARDPETVSAALRKKRMDHCLNEALFLESQGLNRIDEAIRAFGQVLVLDPSNELATKRYESLIRKRPRRDQSEQATKLIPRPASGAGQSLGGPVTVPPPRRPYARYLLVAAGMALIAIAGWRIWAAVSRPTPLPTRPPVHTDASSIQNPIAPPRLARVVVDTSPFHALVTIGGRSPKVAPAVFDSLAPGDYRISAKLHGYMTVDSILSLGQGQDALLVLRLKVRTPLPTSPPVTSPAPTGPSSPPMIPPIGNGILIVHATPAPQYWIDGSLRGSGRTILQTPLPAGDHHVLLDHPDYELKEFDIKIIRDSTRTYAWNFDKYASKIRIMNSSPYGGRVFVDDRDMRVESPKLIPVRPGKRRVRLEVRDGFLVDPPIQTVEVVSGWPSPGIPDTELGG